jgi:hypothetical protein
MKKHGGSREASFLVYLLADDMKISAIGPIYYGCSIY